MIQDPTDRYIAAILTRCTIAGKEILDIGCGKGRITRDLARHAARVVAIDPDPAALRAARHSIPSERVSFLPPAALRSLPTASFDLAFYTLSLHHIPAQEMTDSLRTTAGLLRQDGFLVIIEPGDGGSLTEAKERFGAGSGDERSAREAAVRAMHALDGWSVGETLEFTVLFRFDDERDFFDSLFPDRQRRPSPFIRQVEAFLHRHRTADGIVLDAGRRLNVLYRR